MITFVRETENLDFAERGRVAGGAVPRHPRVRGDLAAARGVAQAPRPAARRARPGGRVLRAPPLGDGGRCAGARVPREPRPRRGGLPRVPARPLAAGAALAQKAQREGFTRDELRAAGLTNARGSDYFPPRLMFPLADARGRIVGFQARKLHEDDPLKGKYVNSPEGELFHKSAILYGLEPRPDGDREAGARRRRRGQHRRDRPAPGRVRARRRVDGDRPDRAAAEGAAATDAPASTSASTRTRPARRRRCAGWSSRPRSGFDVRVVDAAEGTGSRRRARTASRSGSSAPRATSSTASGSSSIARRTARKHSCGLARSLQRNEDSPEWQDALRLLAGRLDLRRRRWRD